MKCLLLFLIVIFCENGIVSALTEAQLQAAMKLTRNMCQPKSKVTDEQLEAMRNGDFDDSKKLMCYVDCCYSTFKVIKAGQFDYEAGMAQIDQMPEERREAFKVTLSNCKDKAVGTQKCEAAYNLAKCSYFDDPPNFMMP